MRNATKADTLPQRLQIEAAFRLDTESPLLSSPVHLCFRDIVLAPVSSRDMDLVRRWEADSSSLCLWTMRKDIVSQEEFTQGFSSRLRNYYHVFLMVYKGDRPEGFIYSYEPHFLDGHAYVTAFLDPTCRDRGVAAVAGVLFANYLFSYFPFRKLYCDVFEYNPRSLAALRGAGLIVEGIFREHRFFGGRHWTMYRMALYREQFYRRFSRLLQRMGNPARACRQ